MILSVMLFVGCDSDRGVYSSGERVPTVQANATNQPESNEEDSVIVYTWDDPYGQEIMDRAAKTYTVKSYLDDYESQGYSFAPEHSFMMEGYGIPNGGTDPILVQFVTLAMTYTPDPARQAMYVTFTESELGFIVASYLLSFIEPDPDAGFYGESDGIWRLNYPAEIGHYRKATDGQATTPTIDNFLDCLAAGSAATCGTALILCGAAGPGYPACAAGGCAAGIIGSAVGCAFATWG